MNLFPMTLQQYADDRTQWLLDGCPSDHRGPVETDPELALHRGIPGSSVHYVWREDGEHRYTFRAGQLVEDLIVNREIPAPSRVSHADLDTIKYGLHRRPPQPPKKKEPDMTAHAAASASFHTRGARLRRRPCPGSTRLSPASPDRRGRRST